MSTLDVVEEIISTVEDRTKEHTECTTKRKGEWKYKLIF